MAMLGKLRRRRFGEILVGDGLISHEQLDEALAIQRSCGDTLGTILLDLGHISESDIVKALSIQYQLPCLRPANYEINRKLVEAFDPLFLHGHLLLPLDRIGSLILVLLQDIPTKAVLEEMQEVAKSDLAIYLGTSTEIKHALKEIAPISAEDEAKIRQARKSSRETLPDDDLDGTGPVGTLDLSSENLLSSLDAAWESIFVESDQRRDD